MSPLFGFLSDDQEREESVVFQEFEDWFYNELEGLEDLEWSDVDYIYSRIDGFVESLGNSLDRFEDTEVPDDISPRLRKMAVSNRKVLIGRLRSFIDHFEVPDEEGYSKMKRFLSEKSSELDKISDKVKKSLVVLSKAQPDATKNIVDSMKDLENRLDVDEDLERTVSVVRKYREMSEKRRRLPDLFEEKKNIERKLEDSLRERENLKNRLKNIRISEDTEAIESKKEKITDLEKRIKKQENRIRTSIAPLKRGFKKMKYFGIDGGREEMLEGYIKSPVETATRDNDLLFLRDTVGRLESSLDGNELDFSEDETQRLESELNKTDLSDIKDCIESITKLKQEIEDAEKSIESLSIEDKVSSINNKVKRKNEEIEELRQRLKKKEEEIRKINRDLGSMGDDIEKIVYDLLGVKLDLEGIKP